MGQHARLSASAAHRWLHCAGSVGDGGKSSVYAATGTLAHDIAAQCLNKALDPQLFLGGKHKVEGFEIVVDQEMVDTIRIYVDVCNSSKDKDVKTWAEMSLLTALKQIDPDFGGTADFVAYDPITKHVTVIDFKFGSGTYVEADDNQQLKIYAIGALVQVDQPVHEVTVKIVQPRFEGAAPVRSFRFNAVELMDFVADLKEAAAKTRLSTPPLASGEWCKFCSKAATCTELAARQSAIMAADFTGLVDYADLAKALASVSLVKERIKAIEEFAYAEATAGRFGVSYGYKLVDKRPVRRWKSEGDVIEWAQEQKIEPYAPRELLSPAQLENVLKEVAPRGKKKAAGAVLAPFIESISSGTVLVPIGDARPEVKKLTSDDFAAIDSAAIVQDKAAQDKAVVNLF